MVGHSDRRRQLEERTGVSGMPQSTIDTSRPTMTGRVSKQERRQAPASPATMRRVDDDRRSLLSTTISLDDINFKSTWTCAHVDAGS